MVSGFLIKLRRFLDNPYINLFVGLSLLYSGVSETINELGTDQSFRFGVHHGIIILAIVSILKTIPDIIDGLNYMHKFKKEEQEDSLS